MRPQRMTPALTRRMLNIDDAPAHHLSDDFKAAFCKTNRSQELGWSTVYGRMSAANAWNNPRNKKEKAKGVDNNIVL